MGARKAFKNLTIKFIEKYSINFITYFLIKSSSGVFFATCFADTFSYLLRLKVVVEFLRYFFPKSSFCATFFQKVEK
jgi:hypothetical protein